MRAKYGMKGPDEDRSSILWFDLVPQEFYSAWKGKLIVEWPPPELSWWRRAHRNRMPILSIVEDSRLDPPMPDWREIKLEWEELGVLSTQWRSKLMEWRGVYYIFDISDGKGTSVQPTVSITFSEDGCATPPRVTEEIDYFERVIPETFDSQSYSGCHQTRT